MAVDKIQIFVETLESLREEEFNKAFEREYSRLEATVQAVAKAKADTAAAIAAQEEKEAAELADAISRAHRAYADEAAVNKAKAKAAAIRKLAAENGLAIGEVVEILNKPNKPSVTASAARNVLRKRGLTSIGVVLKADRVAKSSTERKDNLNALGVTLKGDIAPLSKPMVSKAAKQAIAAAVARHRQAVANTAPVYAEFGPNINAKPEVAVAKTKAVKPKAKAIVSEVNAKTLCLWVALVAARQAKVLANKLADIKAAAKAIEAKANKMTKAEGKTSTKGKKAKTRRDGKALLIEKAKRFNQLAADLEKQLASIS